MPLRILVKAVSEIWSKTVDKQLRSIPRHIADKFRYWVLAVETDGLREVRRLPGYHDEPFRGRHRGQRSVRLSRAYRAFYVERASGDVEIIEVIEVSKHDY
jgi:toxin HigB-1